eukprot:TRINITY_DN44749_c0_g1_i2.p1 TRINITY_DN44749_c0_g1~~TRINITY_DN44749_c0_g1_i2.p1  ORF type:complete len:380 (-),score=61.13 TRINITY_DN44749_c0_g1_i2:460-1599(-)
MQSIGKDVKAPAERLARGAEDEVEKLRRAFVAGTGKSPWPHQVDAVASLLDALCGDDTSDSQRRPEENLLIQHATGSGKSATMALLVHSLAALRLRSPAGISRNSFALVLVLSDRLQLDQQLGDCVESFLRKNQLPTGVCQRADGGGGSLRRALCSAAASASITVSYSAAASVTRCRVIVSTKQKLEAMLRGEDGGGMSLGILAPILERGRVAIICEECHRAHFRGSATAAAVARLFGTSAAAGSESADPAADARAQPDGLVYIGFTATPDARTLQLFSPVRLTDSGLATEWRPIHCYHLGQAERDGVVIDVLRHYDAPVDCTDWDVERKAKWIQEDLLQRCETFPGAFREVAKAMIVCSSLRQSSAAKSSVGQCVWIF